jgi:hypothetical protein
MGEFTVAIASMIAGLFGGTGAVLVWEVVIRPVVQGRAVAEVLSAEVSFNLEYLAAARVVARPNSVPMDFSLSTSVCDSVADRIGDLPPNLVGEVVFLYRYFTELNKLPLGYGETLREFRSYEPGSPNHQAAQRELGALIAVFNQNVQKAIARIELVQPLLLAAASPWWSIRGRRRRKPITLDVDALRQRMERSMRDRQSGSSGSSE